MLLVGSVRCLSPGFGHSQGRVTGDRFEQLLHQHLFPSPPPSQRSTLYLEALFSLSPRPCIVTTSSEGKKLENKCTSANSPPTFWFGALTTLGLYFSFVWKVPFLSVSFLSSPVSSSCPHIIHDAPKGLCWSLHFFPGTLPHHPLHTPVTKVCPVISQVIKNGACTTNVLTETRAQDSAPLALTSVWLKVQEHF